jgi:hypothetical protein
VLNNAAGAAELVVVQIRHILDSKYGIGDAVAVTNDDVVADVLVVACLPFQHIVAAVVDAAY